MFGRVKIQNLIMTKYLVRQNRLRIAFCYQGRGRGLAKQQEAFPFQWKLTKPHSKFSPMFHGLSRIHSVPSLAIPNFIITNCLQDISGFKRLANACGSATTEAAWPHCGPMSNMLHRNTMQHSCSQVSLCYQHDLYSVISLATIIIFNSNSGGRFKKAYELLNLRALKFSPLNKIHIFQCMGKIFCVEFQRYPLKFHTKYLTHTLKGTIFIQHWNFKSS